MLNKTMFDGDAKTQNEFTEWRLNDLKLDKDFEIVKILDTSTEFHL